ncbi:hypothetical protein JTE90_003979 [Oedothorax gibbosus]|uniref:Fe2OG dioxygenase domain-containing protein n=1 Tax=Oedothorax gibbosus TaxID=931172 RepID=A0AAV6UC55_9ARAC|nr:hypothetical protein JTE90_003979 [Oedothorax gibbosus]
MSDDKRRSARTQSRFASDKDSPPNRREKDKSKSSKKGSKAGEKNKNEMPLSKAAEGISLEYQDNSDYSFKDILEEKKKPEELKFTGLHELSKSENGVSKLIYEPVFMVEEQAEELMDILSNTIKWHDKNIVIRGEEFPQPRLVAWYGPFPYTYSGATLEAAEMPQTVLEIKQRVENFLKANELDVELNSVLLNLYRNEKDSVAWHSDDELTMGVSPTIASVSLGSVRKFEMRPKEHTIQQNENLDKDSVFYVNLTPGSLIIMDGCMQEDWQHRVPKEYHDKQPRINLTFRTVHPLDQVTTKSTSSKAETFNDVSNTKKHVEEPRFDVDSFPPLGTTDKPNKAPSANAASVYQSTPNCHPVDSVEHAVDENENQNNLNKDLDCCTLEDSSHYNVMEPEKSSDKSTTASDEFKAYVAEETFCEIDPSPKKVCLENDPTENCEPEKAKKQKSQSSKHRLNINAPDFVPKNINVPSSFEVVSEPIYLKYSLHDLAQYFKTADIAAEEIEKFTDVLCERIDESGDYFSARDNFELKTLCALHAGGQSPDNRVIICNRICSIIRKSEFEDYRSPNRYHGNRTGYGGDNYRSRNFSRSHYRP